MHAVLRAMIIAQAETTPSPTPTGPPASQVTPGVWGFVAIAVVALAVVALLIDMMRRIRRARYRSQVNEELDAELAAQREAADEGDAQGSGPDSIDGSSGDDPGHHPA